MKILYSGFKDLSHSLNGGYDKIIANPLTTKVILSNDYPLWDLKKQYHLRKFPLWLSDFYTRRERFSFDITHLFYGEITMCPFFPYQKSVKHKTVITLHLDIEKQNLHTLFIKQLKYFDGIVVLSSQQQQFYKNKYGIDTTFIPHGFDAPVFNYALPFDNFGRKPDPQKINLIVSGQNYRDFITLEKVVNHFSKINSDLHFHLVGTPHHIKLRLADFKNVSIYPRIDNDSYYSLISFCDYNFLPLVFATANNALLEAQAIGTVSILPNIPGISDYAAPSPNNLFYNSFEDLLILLSSISKTNLNNKLINFSNKFKWSNIYLQLNSFYSML